jgi:hypothetical protein
MSTNRFDHRAMAEPQSVGEGVGVSRCDPLRVSDVQGCDDWAPRRCRPGYREGGAAAPAASALASLDISECSVIVSGYRGMGKARSVVPGVIGWGTASSPGSCRTAARPRRPGCT